MKNPSPCLSTLRLREYFEDKHISAGDVEKKAGLSNASLQKAFRNGTGLTSMAFEKIFSTFKGVSTEYVFRGTKMSSTSGQANRTVNNADISGDTYTGETITIHEGDCSSVAMLEKQLSVKDEQIRQMQRQITSLQEQNAFLTKKLIGD